MRALLIDDSRSMRRLAGSILEQLGVLGVEEAMTPEEACEKLGSLHPDLIVLDWDLPGLDGGEFVRRLRAEGHDAPIVIVTLTGDEGRIAEALRSGPGVRLVKPFSPDLLNQRIREALSAAPAAA